MARISPFAPAQPNETLIGRESFLMEAQEALSQTRLLTLSGLDGSGKTAIGLALAAQLTQEGLFPGGVFLVSLQGVNSAIRLAETLALALGLNPDPLNPLGTVATWLTGRKVLFVLDDADSLPLDPPTDETTVTGGLGWLLGAVPDFKVLATAPRGLELPRWERELPVPPLTPAEAVQLFCHYAPATWQARLDREAVNAICETLNHFPLALMIMAGQMNRAAMTPGRMLCGLRQRMVEVLNERGGPNLSPPAFSLRVALSFAYCALSGRGRLLFFYLGLLPGGMSQPMLDELMGPRFAAAAQELVTYHLAVWPGNAEDGRYRMAAPIRAYTLERRRPARMLLARRRVLQFYANRVTTLDQQLAPLIAGQTLTGSEYALAVRALQSFDQERLNLSAAVEMALLGKMWGTLLILVRRQEAWQTRRALWAERAYHELLAGKAAEELDDELQINLAVHNLGQIYHLQGHWVEAVDTYRQALKLAFDLNAPAIAGVLQSIIALAHTMAEAEQWTMVMRLGYEVSGACEVQTRPGWPTPEIAAQGALCREVGLFLVLTGQACDELTDTETEATLYQEALAQARRIDDQTAARWALAAWIERLG